MTDRAEIERLLQMTGRTLEGLPEKYDKNVVHNRIREITGGWGLYRGMPEPGEHILHQSDVIELLVGALRDALEEKDAALAKQWAGRCKEEHNETTD